MPSPPVVVNNTPLVGLWNLGRLELLSALYESVAIPAAVEAEFLAIGLLAPLLTELQVSRLYLAPEVVQRALGFAGELVGPT